jgi:hypothetical protein
MGDRSDARRRERFAGSAGMLNSGFGRFTSWATTRRELGRARRYSGVCQRRAGGNGEDTYQALREANGQASDDTHERLKSGHHGRRRCNSTQKWMAYTFRAWWRSKVKGVKEQEQRTTHTGMGTSNQVKRDSGDSQKKAG